MNQFQANGLNCFGPVSEGAMLEGSKTFSKDFLKKYAIPTAPYDSFTDIDEAMDYIESCAFPVVIKADGLAAGKGVIIAQNKDEAVTAVTDMLAENRFGKAGSKVVIEAFLTGEEASFICIVDGEHILPMATSQDHKAAYDGDQGPNTGGMGAYSPAPIVDQTMHDRIMEEVMYPTVRGLLDLGIHYVGFLYAGLMIGDDGRPNVLEFNCRFGDPETQPVLMRLQSDLVEHCLAAVEGRLHEQQTEWDPRPALGVVLASEGYPDSYEKGHVIEGMGPLSTNQNQESTDQKLFHAGTRQQDGQILTSGGRVLCATAVGNTLEIAQHRAYELAQSVSWPGSWCRKDIGAKALNRVSDEDEPS